MQRFWFKRMPYGYGWFPATWEGWTVSGVFLAIIILIARTFNMSTTIVDAFKLLVVPALLLIAICYMTGESPKWQWGKGGNDVKDR